MTGPDMTATCIGYPNCEWLSGMGWYDNCATKCDDSLFTDAATGKQCDGFVYNGDQGGVCMFYYDAMVGEPQPKVRYLVFVEEPFNEWYKRQVVD